MPQYYSSDKPTTMAPSSSNSSPIKAKKHDSGRPPLEPGLSERSLDSVTMQSIVTTASMFSSGSGSTRSGESADELRELERRRSSLQTESVVALKIDLAEALAETEAANLALASARRELEAERAEAARQVQEAQEEADELRREYQKKLVTLGQTLEKQSYELASVTAERNELREQLESARSAAGSAAQQRPGVYGGAKAPSHRTLFQQQATRRRQGSLGSLSSIEEAGHRRRGSLGSVSEQINETVSTFNESVGNLISNMSIGGIGSRRASNEDQNTPNRAEDMLWSNRNLVVPKDDDISASDDDHQEDTTEE